MTPPDEGLTAENSVLTRPLLLFDGDCGFCRFWVERWRSITRERVDFAPAQQTAHAFPQIGDAWKRSVQLVTPDDSVYSGAEAVFRALAFAPEHRWPLAVYQRVPGARPVSEAAYRLVADHRDFFSWLTNVAFGREPQPASCVLSRWIFLRLLGLVYFVAFISLGVQVTGLVGSHGLLPAAAFLQAVHQEFGSASYHIAPTLAWISASDAALKLICGSGAVFGILAMLGLLTAPALALAWLCYLSLVTVGQDFLTFQWDILLIETGFLAIFLAPWRWLEPPCHCPGAAKLR